MAAILRPDPYPAPSPRPQLRLVQGGRSAAGQAAQRAATYRRRRLAVLAVVLLFLATAAAAVAVGRGALAAAVPTPAAPAASASSGSAAGTAAGRTVVVQPGDSFWSLARRLQPTGDVRPLVDRLVAAHGDTPLLAGERVVLPVA